MLDGAGASTFLDIIDDRNKDKILQKNSKKITKFSENKVDDKSQTIPFDQVARDQKRNDRKQVVFIDSQIQDYQSLINAFNSDTEVYLIQSNEDGFKKIDNTLKDNSNISSLHIIGHGSAGKILFGNATLSNDTIQSYNQTLRSIGQYLTEDGDILFYGCNVASTEGGKALISKISEITKADIAASDDVTGKSGDWDLESIVGNIETNNISQVNYIHDLAMTRTANTNSLNDSVDINLDGITHIRGAVAAFTGTTDRNAFDFTTSKEHNSNNTTINYMSYTSEGNFGRGTSSSANQVTRTAVVLEKTGITSGTLTSSGDKNVLKPDFGSGSSSSGKDGGDWDTSTYLREISDQSSAYYQLSSTATASDSDTGPMDVYMIFLDSHFGDKEDRYTNIGEVKFDRKIIGLLKDKNHLSNNTVGTIDLHNPNNSTYPNTSLAASSTRGFEFIDPHKGWRAFQGDENSNRGYSTNKETDWVAVDHNSGDLRTIHFGMKNIGGGDLIRVLVEGNSPPAAQNDEGVVNEDGTLTVANSSNANVTGSYDAHQEHSGDLMDTSSASNSDSDPNTSEYGDTIKVTAIQHSSAGSETAVGDYTYDHGSATSVTGTYGTLTIGSDGSYEYVADQAAADALDSGDTATDVFTYTIKDQHPGYDFAYSGTDTATLTITVLGANDPPVAQNDEGYIQEGKTLTVTNGANANVSGGSYDASGEHSGDIIDTSSSSHTDSDADDSASLTVTAIQHSSAGSSTSVSAGSSYNSSGTQVSGTYGTLTIGADGSYTYVSSSNSVTGTVTDVFTYTVSDGTSTDTATLTITIYNSNDPVARNDEGHVAEGGTLDVNDGDNANESGGIDAAGEHSGDVLQTSSGSHQDTDADSDTLVVDSVRTGGVEGNGTAETLGQPLTGTYGQLTLNANGSYSYSANQSAADELDAGDTVTDVFNYTVSDGNGGTDIATITITIHGANDTPVAVDDTDSVEVNETTTATDGSENDVLMDDTDADDSASLTVTAIQPSGGSSSNVSAGSSYNSSGTQVTGTYGTLTIGADGSYTYVADQDAADNISAGSSETDVFTYTVSDGTSTDTATLTITISAPESESNNSEIKKDKKEAKKQKKDEKKARKKEKREKRLLKKSFKLAKNFSERKSQFNQGLKLVDLVAETYSIEVKEKDSFVDKIKTNQTKEGLNVKFKVFNDEGKEVQKYYGIMKDGSPLPDWIKVDPKTGRTKTNIPKDVNIVEFKIIAVDVDNNRKEVTVVIDPEKIAKDKEIIKEARKISIPKKIEVQNNGSVKLNSVNEDGTINKTTTSSINNIESFEDLINTTKPDEFLKLESKLKGNAFVVELPNEIKNNFENFKIVLKDGKKLPEWIKFNLDNGEIIANPPKNIETIDLKIIVEDSNGKITVKDLKVDFSTKNTINSELINNNDTKFVSLSNQLSKEYTNWNDYGSQIIDSL